MLDHKSIVSSYVHELQIIIFSIPNTRRGKLDSVYVFLKPRISLPVLKGGSISLKQPIKTAFGVNSNLYGTRIFQDPSIFHFRLGTQQVTVDNIK